MKDGTKQRFEGNWQNLKGKVQATWGDLTDDEVEETKGRWDQLVGKIKAKTGETRETIERKLEALTS